MPHGKLSKYGLLLETHRKEYIGPLHRYYLQQYIMQAAINYY